MIVIQLPFPPSVNNLFANGKSGRYRTQRYDSWIYEAGAEILRQRPSKVTGPVTLLFEFGNPDNRKRDISNLIKAPEDLLVKHRIIEADDDTIVQEIRAKWCPDVSGVRVTVEPFFRGRAEAA